MKNGRLVVGRTNFLSKLDSLCILTDKGILQAAEAGLLKIPDQKNLKPCTIDVRPKHDLLIGEQQQTSVEIERLDLAEGLYTFFNPRSSVLRRGFVLNEMASENREDPTECKLLNPSRRSFEIGRQTAMGHVYVCVDSSGPYTHLDHGRTVTNDDELNELIASGELGNKKLKAKDGLLQFRAQGRAMYLHADPLNNRPIDVSQKPQYSSEYRSFRIPREGLLLEQNQSVNIPVGDRVKLSPKVAIQLVYSHPADGHLRSGGVVDPGFKGQIGVQPEIGLYHHIAPGDIVCLGRVIYFPNGVQHSYTQRGGRYSGQNWSAIFDQMEKTQGHH